MRRLVVGCSVMVALALTGCVNSLGTHLMLGEARPESDPSKIVFYATEPADAVEIANVAARSTVFRSEAEKTEIALDQLRDEAAEVGANGIVLDVSEDAVLGNRPGIVITPDKLAGFVKDQNHDVMVSGTAIYVPEQTAGDKPRS